ncbi:MAG: efflux RND transporter periplasmic adaptor subunit, partial [Bryobacteraceae bacterium]|nr:efflux RND transporter periplasmic adaptor subunit [Bryobacteraceae bacterium]
MRTRMTVVLMVVFSCLAGCGSRERSAPSSQAASPSHADSGQVVLEADSLKLGQIRTAPVVLQMAPWDEFEAPGKVEVDPNRVSHVFMPVPGRVRQVLVRLGDAVEEGQPLLIIESPEISAAVAAYRQAQAELRRAQSALAKAGRDLGRIRDLFENRAAAQRDVWAAENEVAQAQAAVEQAKAEEEQARHRLELLGISPNAPEHQINVTAPTSGKVFEIAVAAGEFRTDTSASLMTIADLSRVWITSNVPENLIRLVHIGENVEVELAAYPGEVLRGTVRRIADTLDADTRTVKVQTELPNPGGRLRPGMFGRIRHTHGLKQVPAIPPAALVQGNDGGYVFVEAGRGRFQKLRVRSGQPR